MVYNPTVFRCISDFFKIPDEINKSSKLSERIRSAAFERIEEAKQRTKEEFLKYVYLGTWGCHNINELLFSSSRNVTSLLEGQSFERKKWDIVFELSAPQIIIPVHFVDKEALIMVVDFGKFNVTNGEEEAGAGGAAAAGKVRRGGRGSSSSSRKGVKDTYR